MPRRIHFLDALPLTPTGKVRKMILQEQTLALGPAPAPALPAGPTKSAGSVLRGALTALGLTDFPRERSLFDGGVDSLGALDLIESLQASVRRPLPSSLLYEHPTIAALEAHFESLDHTDAVPQEAEEQAEVREERPAEERPMLGALRLLAQMFGLLLRPLVFAAGVVPALVLMDALSSQVARWALFLMAPLGLVVATISSMLVAILIKWVILGRSRPGRYALWSWRYHRWMMVNNLFRCMEYPLGVLRGTALLNVFYRLCGARIGAGVRLDAADLQDLDLVEIGAGAHVGRDANLQPAVLRHASLILEPVKLGAGCVLEPQASILGGTEVPDGKTVRALDVAPSGEAGAPPPRPGAVVRLTGFALVAYATAAAIAAGILFVEWFNGGLPSLLRIATERPARPGRCSSSASRSPSSSSCRRPTSPGGAAEAGVPRRAVALWAAHRRSLLPDVPQNVGDVPPHEVGLPGARRPRRPPPAHGRTVRGDAPPA